MINLKQCTIHGSTILLGKGTSPRERFANDSATADAFSKRFPSVAAVRRI